MTNVEIKKLHQRRGTQKTQIKMFSKFLESYKEEEPDLIKLNVRVNKLKQVFADFDQVSDELEILEEAYDHATERYEIEEDYLNLITKSEHLAKQAADMAPNSSREFENGSYDTHRESSRNTVMKRRIKLPEASLPKFSGRYEDWLSFKDAFTSMIHDQSDLNNIEKLQYLKSAVTGEAENKIKHISITDGNYDRAWNLLQSAFSDRRLIISRHLSLLLRLPVQGKESAEGLRCLADEAQQHLESLKTLGIEVNEEIVVQILEEKLHKLTAEKWEETLKRDTFPQLEEMFEFLYKIAARFSKRDRNKTEKTFQTSAPNKPSQQFNNKNNFRKTTRQAFLSKTGKSCPICIENLHPVYKCEKFRSLSIPHRIQAAKDASMFELFKNARKQVM